VADVLRDHAVLELEAIERLCAAIADGGGRRGLPAGSLGPTLCIDDGGHADDRGLVRNIEDLVSRGGIDLVTFEKGQRKDDVTQVYVQRFAKREGVLYVGKVQENARVMRTERRRSWTTGGTYPWIVESTGMVNHYYFYCVDDDFGPFFVKFCSYFPYNAKLCINGHQYLKRHLAKRRVAFEALDNGIKSCADPALMQRLSDGLSAVRNDRMLPKWLKRLPHPFPARDRAAGYRYHLSILHAEFSLTQVLDQPVMGRIFFEEVIRESLDIGRPSQVRRTPGRFRTRVITEGVVPSLRVDYTKPRIKQYHKEGQALRTETTINDTRDFAIGRRIEDLEELRKIGFAANRRLLDVQRIGHDCFIGKASFRTCKRPSSSTTAALQRGASLIRAFRPCCMSFAVPPRPGDLHPQRSPRAPPSPARIQAEPNRPRTDHLVCACTASPSVSLERTATASPSRDCEPPCFAQGSITARREPDWPSSRRPTPSQNSRWPNPSGVPKSLSTNGTNMQDSQLKNLT
jgi:hypothetical protein